MYKSNAQFKIVKLKILMSNISSIIIIKILIANIILISP